MYTFDESAATLISTTVSTNILYEIMGVYKTSVCKQHHLTALYIFFCYNIIISEIRIAVF